MCGILLNIGNENITVEHEALEVIEHRGPDAAGAENFEFDNFKVGLGHRRLSIIDLSDRGKQPMSYGDGHLWITFNGEIYNYVEIRSELEREGFQFVSDSDTEVLLAAYLKWGEECLQRFNGMFAFAVLDRRTQKLFIARDRFGIKPAYYHNNKACFRVVSEIKQLVGMPEFTPRINNEQLYHFLNNGDFEYCPESIWQGVFEVPPGHCLTLHLDTWRPGSPLKFRKWYDPTGIAVNTGIAYEDAILEFRRLLEQAVKFRLRADVPIGFLLSGGLDSSTLVGLAHLLSENSGKHFKTYSSCYDNSSIDEREFIEAVLEKTGAESCFHFPQPDDITDCMDKVIWHNDLPVLHGSPCPHWLIYQHIRNEMDSRKVIIEGQGADEILCGYGDFQWASMYEKLSPLGLPSFLWQLAKFELHHREPPHIVLRKFRRLMFKDSVKYPANQVIATEALLGGTDVPGIAVSREAETVGELHQLRLLILRYILHYVDRDSMSQSRETRVPFLDHELVEFCLSLPTHFKIDKGFSKRIMRDAVADVLPEKVKKRTDKQGYSSPTASWAQSEWGDFFRKEISECAELPFVKDKELMATLESSLSPGSYFDPILWRLMTVKRWIKIFGVSV